MRGAEHVACKGENRCAYGVLVGKYEGKKPLRRPRHGWEDIVKIEVKEYDGNAWTGFSWPRAGTSGGLL
jgi:hypothetical protein